MFRASAAGLPDEHATVDLSYGIGHERETEKITKTKSEKEEKEGGGRKRFSHVDQRLEAAASLPDISG